MSADRFRDVKVGDAEVCLWHSEGDARTASIRAEQTYPRNASVGSTRVARIAGTAVAITAVTRITSAASP